MPWKPKAVVLAAFSIRLLYLTNFLGVFRDYFTNEMQGDTTNAHTTQVSRPSSC